MMDDIKKNEFGRMDTIHHLLSGFKSTFSDAAVEDIDIARRQCGGAGFSSWSGFVEMHRNTTPVPTYEGDNIVMLLQASRFLLKLVKKVKKGESMVYPFEYLNKFDYLLNQKK